MLDGYALPAQSAVVLFLLRCQGFERAAFVWNQAVGMIAMNAQIAQIRDELNRRRKAQFALFEEGKIMPPARRESCAEDFPASLID
jgi:hypothetical protein